ncbi:MAG: site-specific integrase [Candidatus Rokubacteria bacterium]|nr:site-specific integrase [Candidatus Rokubacteria bacterium]
MSETETTTPRRDRGAGMIYRKRGSPIWTARLYIAVLGTHRKRSTKTTDEQKARRFLAKWHAEVIGGTWLPDADRTTFAELATMLLDDYKANGRRSLDRVEDSLNRLRPVFGHLRARAISRDRITGYARQRREEDGAAPATINRELACLKRMFTLGAQAGKVGHRPHIPMLEERNIRTGFFEREQLDAVLRHLPDDLRPPIHTAYLTGWRLQSELLTRQWRHVDFVNGWLRLDPGETKNGEGRMFPLTPELRAVLEAQRAHTHALERQQGRVIPWVFHRDGEPIRSLRRPWKVACRLAGVPGRLIHDFRRTAVRNLERAGVPRSTAMKMVGHKTESVYRRYAIVDEAMLREGAEKIARLADFQAASVPFSVPTALRATSPAL